MMANHKLANILSDVGFYEFRRQLQYKANLYGSKITVANGWYPSSKLCSKCGMKNDDLTLNIREWTCSNCGTYHDRDINAAQNLLPSKMEQYAATSAVSACGEISSGEKTKVFS